MSTIAAYALGEIITIPTALVRAYAPPGYQAPMISALPTPTGYYLAVPGYGYVFAPAPRFDDQAFPPLIATGRQR